MTLWHKGWQRRAGVILVAAGIASGCGRDETGTFSGTNTQRVSVVEKSPSSGTSSNPVARTPTATSPLPSGGDNAAATELLQAAEVMLAGGKTNEAVQLIDRIARDYPEFEEVHFSRGFLMGQLGRNAEAIQCYETALRLLPDYAEAHNNLGNLLVKEGRIDTAIPHFEAAIAKTPENPNLYNNLGTAYARLGKLSEAIPHFNHAVQLNAEYPDAWFNLGRSYSQLGRYREAILPLQTALKLRPNFVPAQKLLRDVQQKLSPTAR